MGDGFKRLLSSFLIDYLPRRRGCSPNTVAGYRDASVLLLRYAEAVGVRADDVGFDVVDRAFVEGWLGWLEAVRGCSPQTRNNRLAALKSFMRYAQVEAPETIDAASSILGIKAKKVAPATVPYLSLDGIAAILDAAKDDARGLAALALLYDTGARVQELCDADFCDLRLEAPATMRITGKGGKTRVVPLTKQVAGIVGEYASGVSHEPSSPLFVNAGGDRIGRAGIAYILSKYAALARDGGSAAVPDSVTPHMLRHSKAMHMLEAGVGLVTIRDFLGHSSVTTTEIYAKANPEMKREAIETLRRRVGSDSLYGDEQRSELLSWLQSVI